MKHLARGQKGKAGTQAASARSRDKGDRVEASRFDSRTLNTGDWRMETGDWRLEVEVKQSTLNKRRALVACRLIGVES